jgi:hypothetical protein
MPKLDKKPMATDQQLQEAREELLHAAPNQVQVNKLPDGAMQITILTITKPAETQKQGKWAKVAEELAKENLLGDGRGERLRASMKEFRENFQLRDVFIDTPDR